MGEETSGAERPSDWRSYDSVAETYANVVTLRHAVMARDLVALVAPPFGAQVLDVGTGAGAAAHAGLAATGRDGVVVAVDPSVGLLRRVTPRGRIRVAAAVAGELPAQGASFDIVVAHLVLNHVPDYRSALSEMVRVARPGGRVGVTTWGVLGDTPPVQADDEQAALRVWSDAASELVAPEAMDAAASDALPWEVWFSNPTHLRAALEDAGLRRVELTGRAYRSRTSQWEWLSSVHTGAKARYLRASVQPEVWDAFCEEVLRRLRDAIPEPFERVDQTLFAVGTVPRPSDRR